MDWLAFLALVVAGVSAVIAGGSAVFAFKANTLAGEANAIARTVPIKALDQEFRSQLINVLLATQAPLAQAEAQLRGGSDLRDDPQRLEDAAAVLESVSARYMGGVQAVNTRIRLLRVEVSELAGEWRASLREQEQVRTTKATLLHMREKDTADLPKDARIIAESVEADHEAIVRRRDARHMELRVKLPKVAKQIRGNLDALRAEERQQ